MVHYHNDTPDGARPPKITYESDMDCSSLDSADENEDWASQEEWQPQGEGARFDEHLGQAISIDLSSSEAKGKQERGEDEVNLVEENEQAEQSASEYEFEDAGRGLTDRLVSNLNVGDKIAVSERWEQVKLAPTEDEEPFEENPLSESRQACSAAYPTVDEDSIDRDEENAFACQSGSDHSQAGLYSEERLARVLESIAETQPQPDSSKAEAAAQSSEVIPDSECARCVTPYPFGCAS